MLVNLHVVEQAIWKTYNTNCSISPDDALCVLCSSNSDIASENEDVSTDDEPAATEEIRVTAEDHERNRRAHSVATRSFSRCEGRVTLHLHCSPPPGVRGVSELCGDLRLNGTECSNNPKAETV